MPSIDFKANHRFSMLRHFYIRDNPTHLSLFTKR